MSDGLRPLLFQYLSPVACRDCIDIALQEFAALLKYSLTGATRAWRSLRAEEKSSWLSQDYKAELESAPDAWTSHLQSYGWHVQAPSSDCPPDVQEAIRKLLAAGILTKEQVSSVVQDLICKPSGATRASGQEAVGSALASAPTVRGRVVEQMLMKGLAESWQPCSRGMMNFLQVVRGITATCALWYQDIWPSHVGVLSADDEERSDCLDLQQHCRLLLVILQSACHWALMAVCKGSDGTAKALLYDTLEDEDCFNHGAAVLLYLQEKAWLRTPAKLARATVPRQPDGWSCGHRCVLNADRILAGFKETGTVPRQLSVITAEDITSFIAASQAFRKIKLETAGRLNKKPGSQA